jgi:undecaprenyl-diphosphatase
MSVALTIFAANILVFVSLALAVPTLAVLLMRARRRVPAWLLSAATTLLLSLVLARVAGMLYDDPRPFVVEHVTPLVPHAADNGFPSDHALLAAAIVALVFLARPKASLPFAVLAALVDWARVASGVHHVIDVVGSSAIVAAALVVGWLVQIRARARVGIAASPARGPEALDRECHQGRPSAQR